MTWGEAFTAITFVGFPCLGAIASWTALRWRGLDDLPRRSWVWIALGLFLLTRAGTHFVVFHVFRYAGGHDLLEVWTPIAKAVLESRDPSPWIDNLYGPLFPHVLAAGYGLSGGRYPPGIDAPFALADGLALVLLLRVAKRTFAEAVARRLTLAVLLSPVLWHGVIVRTQDEALFLLFLLGTMDLFQRKREAAGVVVAGLGTVFTKALFPFWVLPVLLSVGGGVRRMVLRVAAAGALTIAFLGVFTLMGWDISGRMHPTLDVRGSSTWFVITGSTQPPHAVFLAGLALSALLLAVAGLAAAARRPVDGGDAAARGVVMVQGLFFLLCPFTLPPHLVQGLPFLAWQAVREGVCQDRPPGAALLLGLGYCLFQVPALCLNSEYWYAYPWLIALFAGWWGWTAWRAWQWEGGRNIGQAGDP